MIRFARWFVSLWTLVLVVWTVRLIVIAPTPGQKLTAALVGGALSMGCLVFVTVVLND